MTQTLVILLVTIVVILATYVIAYYHGSKKAENIDNVCKEIDVLKPILSPLEAYLVGRLPASLQPRVNAIAGAFGNAVNAAENAWKNGLLTPDSRKQFATDAMTYALSALNITPDAVTTKLISTGIDLAVGLMLPASTAAAPAAAPPSDTPVPAALTMSAPEPVAADPPSLVTTGMGAPSGAPTAASV